MLQMKLKNLAVKFFCLGILFSSSLAAPLPAEAQNSIPAAKYNCYWSRSVNGLVCSYLCPAGWWNPDNGNCYRTSSQAPMLEEGVSRRLVGLLRDLGMERGVAQVGEISAQSVGASVVQISEPLQVSGKRIDSTPHNLGPEGESQQSEEAI